MAADTTPANALSECASRIHKELNNVLPVLSSALSRAETLLEQAETGAATEVLGALRLLVQAGTRVYRLSEMYGDALDAVRQAVDPFNRLLGVQSAELEYWKCRALGKETLGSKIDGSVSEEGDQMARWQSADCLGGIGSPLHEAITARLDATLVAELEADAMARLVRRKGR
jgi:hypothetical protein